MLFVTLKGSQECRSDDERVVAWRKKQESLVGDSDRCATGDWVRKKLLT